MITGLPECEATNALDYAIRYLRSERGLPLDFEAHFYAKQIILDEHKQKGFLCGSQVGKTTTALAELFWLCESYKRPLRGIYTMHTQEAVEEFAQTRAKLSIQASAFLSAHIQGIDNVGRKAYLRPDGTSIIFFKGAKVGTQALSEPADIVLHDELNFSRPDVLRLYEDRIAHSELAWRRAFGTPTVPGFGLSKLWESSNQLQWQVKCAVCGDERPIIWPASFAVDADEPHFICAHGHELTWARDIRAGRWGGNGVRHAKWSMYRVPRALLEPWTAARIVNAWNDEQFMELFFNQVMGQEATTPGMELTPELIARLWGDWRQKDRDPGPCFLGADPGGGVKGGLKIHVAIGRQVDEQRHWVRMGYVKSWESMDALMAAFNVRMAVVDGAFDPTKAAEFCKRYPNRVWLAFYPTMPVKGREQVRLNKETRVADLDRLGVLDQSAERLIMQLDKLPRGSYAQDKEITDQLCSMVRGSETGTDGLPKSFWQETSPDHLRHAHSYGTVAANLMHGIAPSVAMVNAAAARGTGTKITARNASTGEMQEVDSRPASALREPTGLEGLEATRGTGITAAQEMAESMYPALRAKRLKREAAAQSVPVGDEAPPAPVVVAEPEEPEWKKKRRARANPEAAPPGSVKR